MTSSPILTQLQPVIMQNRGARFEADLFDRLLEHPHSLRSFEFAAADGAIDCSADAALLQGPYSDRLWEIEEAHNETFHDQQACRDTGSDRTAVCLALFDGKSNLSENAEGQIYSTTLRQRQVVSFYVGVCASNPSYVELFPNYFAQIPMQQGDDPSRRVAVNLSRKSAVSPKAYDFLSPCNAPYRMPASMLLEAFSRVRDCVQACDRGETPRPYVNPWSGAVFTKWRPRSVHSTESLLPADDSQHGTGCAGIMEIWREIRVAQAEGRTTMRFHFVGVQPRLADFKLLVPFQPPRNLPRQVFVQYKIDSVDRSCGNKKIAIGRYRGAGVNWYFTDLERYVET